VQPSLSHTYVVLYVIQCTVYSVHSQTSGGEKEPSLTVADGEGRAFL
jgi:hypothetical protein